eukprot:jgi/Mesen1/4605/ME000233S03899
MERALADQEEEDVGPRRTVLVVGATGGLGRYLVHHLLLTCGCHVTALVSSTERARQVLEEEMGLAVGRNPGGSTLRLAEGDITDAAALTAALAGCDGVVCAVGARYAAGAYAAGSSPQDVYLTGVAQLVRAAGADGALEASPLTLPAERSLFDFSLPPAAADGAGNNRVPGWQRLDDVIMGGISDSTFTLAQGRAVFEGTVRVEGGGFCGARALLPGAPLDLAHFDGIRLRLRGDGQRYKLNLRTSVGIVLSRFQYEGFPNPLFTPGPFKLEVESISAYRGARPQLVLVSSAAVERNARASTPQLRDASIPIVKLNPGGILTWKLAGEDWVRNSGLCYAIVRPCGLTSKDADSPFLLEVGQGDSLTGLLSRQEAARVCAQALLSPAAANCTFEVRRDELTAGVPVDIEWTDLFSRLRPDVRPSSMIYTPAASNLEGAD